MSHTSGWQEALGHEPLPGANLRPDLSWLLYPAYGTWQSAPAAAFFSSRQALPGRRGRWPDPCGRRTQTWTARLEGRVHIDRPTMRCHLDVRTSPGQEWCTLDGRHIPGDRFGVRTTLRGSPTLGYTGSGMLTLDGTTDTADMHLRPEVTKDAEGRVGLELLLGISTDRAAFEPSRQGRGRIILAVLGRFLPRSPEWLPAPRSSDP